MDAGVQQNGWEIKIGSVLLTGKLPGLPLKINHNNVDRRCFHQIIARVC